MIKSLLNIFGWSTNRKIVVMESDDWGSVRMPSQRAYEQLSAAGLELDKGSGKRYNRYDRLESPEDINALCSVLLGHKDKNGRPPVFTAMTLMGNPDFDKIKASDYQNYFWEPFTTTYLRYGYNSFPAFQEAINTKVIYPEFHGREHLNVASWLRALQQKDQQTLAGFDLGFWGFRSEQFKPNYQAAYDFWEETELEFHQQAIEQGIQVFTEHFGYTPSHFAPPNGSLALELEPFCSKMGLKSYVSARKQLIPKGHGKHTTKWRWPGQKNKFGQRYLMRNCFFEPNATEQDWVSTCLKEMETAFLYKKPVIIGNHRTSFMGGISVQNRDSGLRMLDQLLTKMLLKWPDIEFMTAPELVALMNGNHAVTTN